MVIRLRSPGKTVEELGPVPVLLASAQYFHDAFSFFFLLPCFHFAVTLNYRRSQYCGCKLNFSKGNIFEIGSHI